MVGLHGYPVNTQFTGDKHLVDLVKMQLLLHDQTISEWCVYFTTLPTPAPAPAP